LPERKKGILESLQAENMISQSIDGMWSITNLGAILFAKDIEEFTSIKRKAIRVIQYKGQNKIETIREQIGKKGYAAGFENLITYITALLPENEVIEQAIRTKVSMYPEIAVRELIVNAIIHQDFMITGTGPMIEIFNDRIEITNPGIPLIETNRFLDSPPRSRNEGLASFMRRIGICEERGSGIDKVVFQTEFYQLPAPIFEVAGDHTRSILFAHRPLSKMDKEDRIRACYLHACLNYVSRIQMTNTTLRERFKTQDSTLISRIIKDSLDAGLIRIYNPEASKKYMKYLPFWA